jgi:deoxyribose-phosphate aldolase
MPKGPVMENYPLPQSIEELARYFDHTCLKQDATSEDIIQLCNEAKQWQVATVCVNPCYLPLAKQYLDGSKVLPITVIGFPLGTNSLQSKIFETKEMIDAGALEIDMVQSIGLVKEQKWQALKQEIQSIVNACSGIPLKVIFEISFLTPDEIKICSEIALEAGAQFIKTSTGFSKSGATSEAIQIMRSVYKNFGGVKASGGIRTWQDAKSMIQAGATRIGASQTVAILQQFSQELTS